jgi:hypothetical protein
MSRDSFVFYRSFYESIKDLNNDEISEIFKAICEFGLNENEIELNGIAKYIIPLIKPQLKASSKRHEASIENGKKGGRPKITQEKTQENLDKNPRKPKGKTQENLNDNDNDNKNENSNENMNSNCNRNIYTQNFEKFWIMYKAKGKKGKAFEYWKKFQLENQAERVFQAVEIYNNELKDEQYRKYAEGWLNGLLETYLEKVDNPQLNQALQKKQQNEEEIWNMAILGRKMGLI